MRVDVHFGLVVECFQFPPEVEIMLLDPSQLLTNNAQKLQLEVINSFSTNALNVTKACSTRNTSRPIVGFFPP